MVVDAGTAKCPGCSSSREARAGVTGPVRSKIKGGFREGGVADLDVHDCIGLAVPFDLENDSCWAKGNVGAKAGNVRQP